MPNSLKLRFKKLSSAKKVVLLGSVLAVVGVFLPWYRDIDRFNTGDMFLGIGGPLYLAGIIVLLAGGISAALIAMELLEKPLPRLPMKQSHFHVAMAGLSLLMLVIASSVYFHNKFGINLTDKSMGIGMIFGYIGSLLLLAGGVMFEKSADLRIETDEQEEVEVKPLIDLNVEDRVQSRLDRIEKDETPRPVQSVIGEDEDTNDLRFHG